MEYWAIHINDGMPGSDYCLQVESRLTTLRHLDQMMSNGKQAAATDRGLAVFISHSSKDKKLAAAVIELLKSALGLLAGQIRCSSVDGYRLPVGVSSEAKLREEVNAATVVVALLTPNSLASYFVMFELGARWGSGHFLAPLLAGVTPGELQQPLSLINGLSAHTDSQLCQLVENIAAHLGIPVQSAASYLRNVSAVRELANLTSKASATGSKLTDTQKESVFRQENKSLIDEIAQLQEQSHFKGTVRRIAGRSYVDGDDDEICSRCAEVEFRVVHLMDMNLDGRGRRATCPQCKTARGDFAPPIPRTKSEQNSQAPANKMP